MNEIKQHIEDITDYLLTLTEEERLIWFKKNMYLKPLNFIKEINNTTYAVRTYFNNNANENITEKVERIILKDKKSKNQHFKVLKYKPRYDILSLPTIYHIRLRKENYE